MERYIERRAAQLAETLQDKEDVFIGVEFHPESDRNLTIFDEGRVMESDGKYIIVDVRKTLKKKLAENGIEVPGILILENEKYTHDNGFDMYGCNIFITD